MKAIDELFAAPDWTQSRREELANSISHGLGLAGALIAAPFLVITAARHDNTLFFLGTILFVVSMLFLYLCSTAYHAWPQTRLKCVLQVIDHAAIFLLIAGTYSPFTLGPLRGPFGWAIFALIWTMAICGVVLKLRSGLRRKKLSLSIYVGMGWLILIAIRPLASAVPVETLIWLFAGGVAYTGGIIFFVRERVRFNHFIWHLFVLTGTLCHFCAVLSCVA
jgi:hemolysin III